MISTRNSRFAPQVAPEKKTSNLVATECADCARLLPWLAWVLAWLAAGRREAQAHAESEQRGAGPGLLRWDPKIAHETDYRRWVATQLYSRGVIAAEPGEPEAREAWWATVARHARGRGGWRRQFEAWRYGVPFEEDAQPPLRLSDIPDRLGNAGIRGAPPLLILIGGGDLPAVLRNTVNDVHDVARHLRALQPPQPTVKCPACGRRTRAGRCEWCGAPASTHALRHVEGALTDDRLAGWFVPGRFDYRAGIRDAAGQLAEAIVARPSWKRSDAIAVIAAQVHLTPPQLRKLASRPAA